MHVQYMGVVAHDGPVAIHRYQSMIEGRVGAVNVPLPTNVALAEVQADVERAVTAAFNDLGVREWFAQDRNRPPEEFDALAPIVQAMWRNAYLQRLGSEVSWA